MSLLPISRMMDSAQHGKHAIGCAEDAWVEQAITAGFKLVMPADSSVTLDDYTRRVVRAAVLERIETLGCCGRA